jgi:hypothetical protein
MAMEKAGPKARSRRLPKGSQDPAPRTEETTCFSSVHAHEMERRCGLPPVTKATVVTLLAAPCPSRTLVLSELEAMPEAMAPRSYPCRKDPKAPKPCHEELVHVKLSQLQFLITKLLGREVPYLGSQ